MRRIRHSLTVLPNRPVAANGRRDRLVRIVPLPRAATPSPGWSVSLALVHTARAPLVRGLLVYRREDAPTPPPAA
ncbi:MAG TPA: hypothetical protein VFL91_14750 [Thermomicrobiales bacterium]|nr:hypothetical protein [Thermomicrobiales bacterium]